MEVSGSSTTTFSTFLFTDIEGSSVRWLEHRPAMEKAVARHDALVREAAAQFRGEIFKTAGDAFFISFKRPANAVKAAVAAQRALRREDWSAVDGLNVRMAVHIGSAELRGGDYFGPAVNRTARLLELGHGGQILATASMAEVLAAEREVDALEKVGEAPLDDPAQPVDIYQVACEDLPREFPDLRASGKQSTSPKTSRIPLSAQKRPTRAMLVAIIAGLAISSAGWFYFLRSRNPSTPLADAFPGKSVAVLAFADLSEDKQNDYLSDGISEELINMLSKVPELKVAARTSTFSFKGKDTPVPEIARQLGVAYVVEGSVRKSGNRVRITAQLINAADGFHLWSDSFDREVRDIFVVQDEIAALIASNLKLKLAVAAKSKLSAVNPEAYRLYVEGMHFWSLRSTEALKRAQGLFTQAIALDPAFARAYIGLADCDLILSRAVVDRNAPGRLEAAQHARAIVDQALQLDPNLAEAYAASGNIYSIEERWDESQAAFEKALTLNPNYASGHQWFGRMLWRRGDLPRAEEELKRAIALDPFAPILSSNLGLLMNELRRYGEALESADRALALQPNFSQGLVVRAEALAGLGRRDDAIRLYREFFVKPPGFSTVTGPADWAGQLARLGEKEPAERELATLDAAKNPNRRPRIVLFASLGRFDEAYAQVDGLAKGDCIVWDFTQPMWDPVRKTPRFRAMVERQGLLGEYDKTWQYIETSMTRDGAK